MSWLDLFFIALGSFYALEVIVIVIVFAIIPAILDYITMENGDSHIISIHPKTKNKRAFLVLFFVVFPWIVALLLTSLL